MQPKVDRDYAKQIGQRIKKERKEKGLSLKDLGQAVGLSEQAISQYERGVRLISNETLKRICDVLANSEKPAPPVTVVAWDVYEQVRWERDIAISQLKELGIGLGQIMPDMVEVVRCKDCINFMEYSPTYEGEVEGADGDCWIRKANTEYDPQFCAVRSCDFCSLGKKKA